MTSPALTRALLPFFLIPLAWSAKGIADPVPQADAIGEPWRLTGLPTENEEHINISGIAMSKDREILVVGADEESAVQILLREDDGTVDKDSIVRASLRTIFANHPILSPFRAIPSKEDGIDIEGLALIPDADDKKKAKLVVGLRGPVLRGPHAVVLVVDAERKKSELELELDDTLYLPLGGRGIRGLSRLDDDGKDFLVLAGPVGDAPVSYMVYQWNGKDGIPEIDDLDAAENLPPLCGIPQPAGATGAKAEGIHVLKQDNGKPA